MSSNLTWKRRLGNMWHHFTSVQTLPRKVILIYHSVGGGPMSLPVAQFKEHLDWLGKYAQVVSLDELIDYKLVSTGLQVALTFDDGYRTLFNVVAPLLAERNWSATVYLNTGHVADQIRQLSQPQVGHYPGEEFLLWDEVMQLSNQGWIIGSHGVEHLDLTKTDSVEVDRQLSDARSEIESRLGQSCRHFAYTWGNCNRPLLQKVGKAGYTYAAAAIHGPLTLRSQSLAFPRIDVRREYSLPDFVAVVRGDWDYLGFIQKFRRYIR